MTAQVDLILNGPPQSCPDWPHGRVLAGGDTPASLAAFVVNTFRHTQNDQIAFSPEFTTCNPCLKTSRGQADTCSYCGSEEVDDSGRLRR